jgi:hypothetical protein
VVPPTDLPHDSGRLGTGRNHAESAARAQRVVVIEPGAITTGPRAAIKLLAVRGSSRMVPLKRLDVRVLLRAALLDEDLADAPRSARKSVSGSGGSHFLPRRDREHAPGVGRA